LTPPASPSTIALSTMPDTTDTTDTTDRATLRHQLMWFPHKEFKLERTRIKRESLRELMLKTLYTQGALRGMEIARLLCVPFSQLEQELVGLKQRRLCAVVGGAGVGGYEGMDFSLTESGEARAADIMSARPYTGPVPVDLSEYVTSVEEQTLDRLPVKPDELRACLRRDMVVADETVDQIGAALASGGPLLLHGAPGNGKTLLVEHLAGLLGDGVFVPHAIEVDGQVVRLFDERVHRPVLEGEEAHAAYDSIRTKADSRWVFVHRPFVVVGGELDLSMLELAYQETVKVHEAPLPLKANCGLLLIDDLGRQRVPPRDFLNRWIYPLEKRIDHLTLVTGKKIRVPFRQLLVFSTNLEPAALADEAFWRRIRYKVQLPDPTAAEFRQIFEGQCEHAGIEFCDPAFVHLMRKHYHDRQRSLRACHPRDLIQHMADFAGYRGLEPRMTDELVDQACATYFVE